MKEVYRIMNYQYLGEKEVVDAGFMNAKKCVTKLREYEQKITSGALQFGRLLDHQEQTEEEALKIPAGIMAALAAPKLVRSDPRVLSLIGTGPVNYCALLCFLELFPSVDTIKLKGSSLNSRSAQNIRDYLQEDYPREQESSKREHTMQPLFRTDFLYLHIFRQYGLYRGSLLNSCTAYCYS